ncbi:MAG: hypothetical protein NT076_05285 [Candidatus Pacearchaeota archaeon]|nr:hypothetical protein [Candidatus Pacearchaeota archaeon]
MHPKNPTGRRIFLVNVKEILKKELGRIKPTSEELAKLEDEAKTFCLNLERSLKKRKIKASVFIGGSLAKKTILKKENQENPLNVGFSGPRKFKKQQNFRGYDIDIFVRFDSKYKDCEISDLLAKSLKATRIHGSRDYFQIKKGKVTFEIIPVIKVNKARGARNITDLSYFHVSYVLGKLKKNPRLADEIMLAKSFCHGQEVYGAESYISGFSGYALELLVIYYKSLINFLKIAGKAEQIVLDPEKLYKNKQDILESMNEAKLTSPIIFVDPTNKNRNALAALSKESFLRFQKASSSFLKKPSLAYFQAKKINEKNYNSILKARTNRQEGNIAGSKLKKFFGFVERGLEKNFSIEKKDFEYDNKKEATLYFKIKAKSNIIVNGPPIEKADNLEKFKEKHKNTFIKNGKIYAKEQVKMSVKEFLKEFKTKNKKIIESMGITELD